MGLEILLTDPSIEHVLPSILRKSPNLKTLYFHSTASGNESRLAISSNQTIDFSFCENLESIIIDCRPNFINYEKSSLKKLWILSYIEQFEAQYDFKVVTKY